MNLAEFYNQCRRGKLLGPVLDANEFAGLNALLTTALAHKLPRAHLAYVLATAYHETAGTMQPIREMGGNGYFTRMYDIKGARPKLAKDNGNIYAGDGAKFYGRGYVQITWRGNYDRIGKKIGVDLVNHPDLALEANTAAIIAVEGMVHGWFTGRKLSLLPSSGSATREQFKAARPIINGKDKADLIAGYALTFQDYLKAAEIA